MIDLHIWATGKISPLNDVPRLYNSVFMGVDYVGRVTSFSTRVVGEFKMTCVVKKK